MAISRFTIPAQSNVKIQAPELIDYNDAFSKQLKFLQAVQNAGSGAGGQKDQHTVIIGTNEDGTPIYGTVYGNSQGERAAAAVALSTANAKKAIQNDAELQKIKQELMSNPDMSVKRMEPLLKQANERIQQHAKMWNLGGQDLFKEFYGDEDARLKANQKEIEDQGYIGTLLRHGVGGLKDIVAGGAALAGFGVDTLTSGIATVTGADELKTNLARNVLELNQAADDWLYSDEGVRKEAMRRQAEGDNLWDAYKGNMGMGFTGLVGDALSFAGGAGAVAKGAGKLGLKALSNTRVSSAIAGAGLGELGYGERVLSDPNLTDAQKDEALGSVIGTLGSSGTGAAMGAFMPGADAPYALLAARNRALGQLGREAIEKAGGFNIGRSFAENAAARAAGEAAAAGAPRPGVLTRLADSYVAAPRNARMLATDVGYIGAENALISGAITPLTNMAYNAGAGYDLFDNLGTGLEDSMISGAALGLPFGGMHWMGRRPANPARKGLTNTGKNTPAPTGTEQTGTNTNNYRDFRNQNNPNNSMDTLFQRETTLDQGGLQQVIDAGFDPSSPTNWYGRLNDRSKTPADGSWGKILSDTKVFKPWATELKNAITDSRWGDVKTLLAEYVASSDRPISDLNALLASTAKSITSSAGSKFTPIKIIGAKEKNMKHFTAALQNLIDMGDAGVRTYADNILNSAEGFTPRKGRLADLLGRTENIPEKTTNAGGNNPATPGQPNSSGASEIAAPGGSGTSSGNGEADLRAGFSGSESQSIGANESNSIYGEQPQSQPNQETGTGRPAPVDGTGSEQSSLSSGTPASESIGSNGSGSGGTPSSSRPEPIGELVNGANSVRNFFEDWRNGKVQRTEAELRQRVQDLRDFIDRAEKSPDGQKLSPQLLADARAMADSLEQMIQDPSAPLPAEVRDAVESTPIVQDYLKLTDEERAKVDNLAKAQHNILDLYNILKADNISNGMTEAAAAADAAARVERLGNRINELYLQARERLGIGSAEPLQITPEGLKWLEKAKKLAKERAEAFEKSQIEKAKVLRDLAIGIVVEDPWIKSDQFKRVQLTEGMMQKTRTPIMIVRQQNDIPEDVRKRLDIDENTLLEAVYDSKNHTAWIVADHISSMKRGAEVLAHEVVAHGGLRRMFGDEEYTKLMQRLYDTTPAKELDAVRQEYEQAGLVETDSKGNLTPESKVLVMDEYIAKMVEKRIGNIDFATPLEQGVWKRFVSDVRRGINHKFGDKKRFMLDDKSVDGILRSLETLTAEGFLYDSNGKKLTLAEQRAKRNAPPDTVRASFVGPKALQNLYESDPLRYGRSWLMSRFGPDYLKDPNLRPELRRSNTRVHVGADNIARYEISDTGPGIIFKAFNKSAKRITDLLEHPELYTAMPELLNTNITIKHNTGTDVAGSHSYSNGVREIEINIALPDAEATLIHELQHALQQYDDMNKGSGSRHEAARVLVNNQRTAMNKSDIERLAPIRAAVEYAADYCQKAGDSTAADALSKLAKLDLQNPDNVRFFDSFLNYYYGSIAPKAMLANTLMGDMDATAFNDFFTKQPELNKAIVKKALAYGVYEHSAGEVEARATEGRLRYTDDERLANDIAYEYAFEDQFVYDQNGDVLSADAPIEAIEPRIRAEEVQQDIAKSEASQRQQYSDALADYSRRNGGGVATDKAPEYQINDAARKAYQWVTEIYEARHLAQLDAALQAITRLSPMDESWWLTKCTNLSRRFATHRALLGEWCLNYFADPNKPLADQPLYALINDMDNKISGTQKTLGQARTKQWEEFARDIARRQGRMRNYNEVSADLGDAAVCLHILNDNVNEKYVEHWREKKAALEAKKFKAPEDWRAIRDYERYIQNNIAERDNPNPDEYIGAGYSDGQARAKLAELERQGFTREEMEQAARFLSDWNAELTQYEMQLGNIAPEQYAALMKNGYQWYVPLVSEGANNHGAITDSKTYYGYNVHERRGMYNKPVNAFTSTLSRVRRIAAADGTRDVGNMLMVMAELNEKNIGIEGLDNGLRLKSRDMIYDRASYNYTDMAYVQNYYQRVLKEGGFLVKRPEFDDAGRVVTYKDYLVYFEPNWVSKSGRKGSELNETLLQPKKLSGIQKAAADATSLFGQTFTRFRPWFGVVNAGRDFFERTTHLFNTNIQREDGTYINGYTLLPRFSLNASKMGRHLFGLLYGDPSNTNDPYYKYWQEYNQYGVHQEYTWALDGSRQSALDTEAEGNTPKLFRLNGKGMEGAKEAIAQSGDMGRRALTQLDRLNDVTNNITPFAEYVTLREAGVSAQEAAHQTLKHMNLEHSGTATNALRVLFPFVKPIMQSAAATARTLGLVYDPRGFYKAGVKGWVASALMFGAVSALAALARDSMGKDEDGNDRIDQLSLSKLARGIPFGLGGSDYFFLQTGYGLPRLVNTLAWGVDKIQHDLMTPEQVGRQLLLTFAQEMSPGNWPEFSFTDNPAEYILQLITPAALSPITEVATGMTSLGVPIKRGEAAPGVAKADSGGGTSMKAYNRIAQGARDWFGIDMYPEEAQHLIQGMLPGATGLLRQLWEPADPSLADTEHYKDTHLHPFLEALGATMSFGVADDVASAMFRQSEARIIRQLKDNGIKLSSDTAYKRGDTKAKENWIRQQCLDSGLTDDQATDIILYSRAVNALRSGKKEINDYLRARIANGYDEDEILTEYTEATKSRRDIYREFVNNANMYKGR